MKNQYFGDINDYRKYGLLRILSDNGRNRIAVCWMLTENDGRADGRKIEYLRNQATLREIDGELFDALHGAVLKGYRDVQAAEAARIIPSATYCREIMNKDPVVRASWFNKFLASARGSDLIFFDPDNGIEVKSCPKVHKRSIKHLY
jgi:hypothetical protein